MSDVQPDANKSRRTVLQLIEERTGIPSKVLLSDSDSLHGSSPVVDPSAASSKLVPQGRGNYQLLGEIARGGMGVILKGHDTDLGRDVAVKVLDKALAQNSAVVQRFVEEAQIGGQLQHPGIVPVYELGLMADDTPYFTMKLVKGRTLAALFQQRKSPIDNRGRLLAIFESVCQTMAYAHSKSVLHRDLKPANIMVGAFGEVQVVDWGLAKVLRRGGVADEKRAKETIHTIIETVRSGSNSSGSDSMVGSVMGTPAYMAPEQAQGEIEKLDERADVFSLGAILCELLTGAPPYEDIEGETTVMQAARAKLDPARARIEACEADPVLIKLCLDCLTPAKAARPATADEVAKRVHDYSSSVEERAQRAEVAALEARIKADEERRARRLTLALAGAVAAVVAIGGGAWYWIQKDRDARARDARTAVESAQGEAIEFGRAGKPTEALASAKRALALAESGGVDAALLDRAQKFVAQAQLDVGAAERERTMREQDETLRKRLVELRLEQVETNNVHEREVALDKEFTQAFHDYGVDLEGDDLVPALKRIRERSIAEEVALALDDWGRVRRRVYGDKSDKVENLFSLAMDLDPDAGRMRLRRAIFDNDVQTLLDLASPQNLPKLAPGSIFVLSATLWDRYPEHRPDVYRMYDEARHLYPSDFVLQAIGGTVYQFAGRNEDSLICRAAALSLRPDDAMTRIRYEDSLFYVGRLTEALGAARAAVAAYPTNAEAHYNLGMVLVQLGDFSGALESVAHSLELVDDPSRRADRICLRFRNGLATRADVERAVASEPDLLSIATFLYTLLDSTDPAQRNPAFVLKQLADNPLIANAEWRWLVETVARVRAEDWRGALTALGDHYTTPAALILTPAAFDFLRSLIYSRIGNRDAARDSYTRGMVGWAAITGGNPGAWERSDVMRWRREAEAALAN